MAKDWGWDLGLFRGLIEERLMHNESKISRGPITLKRHTEAWLGEGKKHLAGHRQARGFLFLLTCVFLVALDAHAMAADAGTIARQVHERGNYAAKIRGPVTSEASYDDNLGDFLSQWSDVVQGAMYLALVLTVLVISWAIYRGVRRWYQQRGMNFSYDDTSLHEDPVESNTGTKMEVDPRRLWADGRYREAFSATLMRALLSGGWRPEGAQRVWTAREIVASEALLPIQQNLFRLVAYSEPFIFGGKVPSEREFFEFSREVVAHDDLVKGHAR